jgi:hypothetical protein
MRAALLVLSLLLTLLALPVPAAVRVIEFPTAFRPHPDNNVVMSATAPLGFVASRDTDTLFAFDPRGGQQLGQLRVGDGPVFLRLLEQPGRRLLAVACDPPLALPTNVVTIVDATDPASLYVTRILSIPGEYEFLLGPSTIRFTPDGLYLVLAASNRESAEGLVLVFDLATGQQAGQVGAGIAPGSADLAVVGGRLLYVLSESTEPGRVSIVDVTSPTAPVKTGRVKLPPGSAIFNVNNVVTSQDGRYGYVASGGDNRLYCFETETARLVGSQPVGDFPTRLVAFARYGQPRLLAVGENSASLHQFDCSNPASPVQIGVFDANSYFLDTTPVVNSSGRNAFIASSADDRLFAVRLDDTSLDYGVIGPAGPASLAVWEAGGTEMLAVLSTETNAVAMLRAGGIFIPSGDFRGPAGAVDFTLYQNILLAPDGRHAFVASRNTNELLVLDVNDARIVGRVGVSEEPSRIAWIDSPTPRVAVLGSGDAVLTFVSVAEPAAPSVVGRLALETPYPFLLEFANIAVASDGRTLFVADGYQSVFAIDGATGEVLGVIGTGFNPVSLSLYEARGVRRLAVLNAAYQSTSLVVVDASNPASMRRVSECPFPRKLVVALNNIPVFSQDGSVVMCAASFSDTVLTVIADTGVLAGKIGGAAVVRPAPYTLEDKQYFVGTSLGPVPASLFRVKRSGAPRRTGDVAAGDAGFFVVGNNASVALDGTVGYLANYGSARLLRFDPASGAITGELQLGEGPAEVAIDYHSGVVAAVEVNGTASRIVVGNLGDIVSSAPSAFSVVKPSVSTTASRSTRGASPQRPRVAQRKDGLLGLAPSKHSSLVLAGGRWR